MHNVLILGGSGLVGKAIIRELDKYREFQIYATYFKSPLPFNQDRIFKLNIEDSANISSILNTLKPQSVISCLSGDYNKQLILHTKIAEHLKETEGRLYFFSTLNVFDNDLSKYHYEHDLPDSCTDYGQYKIACENRMIEILHDNVCILRLPQVWGKDSPRMKYLLNSLINNEEIVVYPKLLYNANTDFLIAKQLYYIIENKLKGIFHLGAEDVVNHKGFYNELILGLGFNNARIQENFEEEGYFALLSERHDEFPGRLRLMNKSVISYLIN
ncbi:RmlD substrate binding domain protein [Desulfosporosinus acididurans]|uniref:dTDP-4-dehydrorhamnose reductase n=1 Tax=Desulfosporosinus acididurans TaxID=476652 RepID=A0A0J1FJP6_9FIRM|nr:sugar nucleotide-binding protein [Desulfosporosinus acididurans]KLU63689.1 RmlD substrate binding domain protein [Desulfosporosinus acididurans]